MNHYTSDLHLGCKSVLKNGYFGERPFETLEEMHTAMIERWNSKVNNSDNVYILGDIGMRGYSNMHVEILAQLKGQKHLIIGNHDDVSDARVRQQFVEVTPYKEVYDNFGGKSYKLVLCHFPIMFWRGQHDGWIHLYGHTHKTGEDKIFQAVIGELDGKPKAYNVGCMHWDYTPVSLKEMLLS